jgi:DNA-binding transcriptional regulator YiaG
MSRARWERLVGRWRRSGLTSREFAARVGVNRGTLTYWAWRLKR